MRTRPTRFIATIVGVLSGLASATGSCSTIDELWPTAGVRITVQTNAYVRHSYRAHVDGNLSAYTLTPAGIFLVEVGQPSPFPPEPTVSGFAGSLDLELRTYVWNKDSYGTRLAVPVIEHWLLVSQADLDVADPALTFSLPSSKFRVYPDGSFAWSPWGCPDYPHAPWPPSYHQSCSVYTTYGASLTGRITASGLEINGYWSPNDPFADTESYRIVTAIQGPNDCQIARHDDQANFDSDREGDACDADVDNDGIADRDDPDPFNRFRPNIPSSVLPVRTGWRLLLGR